MDTNEKQTSIVFSSEKYLFYQDQWYTSDIQEFPFEAISEYYVNATNLIVPISFASYLTMPEGFSYEALDQDVFPRSVNGCSYLDIVQMDASKAAKECWLTPGIVAEDRLIHSDLLMSLPWLDDLLQQVFDGLFAMESKLDQKYAHLLTKMGRKPITAYRERIAETPYRERVQCGYDIGMFTFDELLLNIDHIVLVEASGDSSSFYSFDRWPAAFSTNSSTIESSFVFEVKESYYGSVVAGDVDELLYHGGIVDGIYMDCAGLYEEFNAGDQLLLSLSDDIYVDSDAEPLALYRETHFYQDSLLKINSKNRSSQSKKREIILSIVMLM